VKTPILGSSYVIRSVNAADNRMVNLYPEVVPEGGKEPAYLQRCPGLALKANIGTGPIRGLWTLGDYLYVVSGNEMYKLNNNYVQQGQNQLMLEDGFFILLEDGSTILLENQLLPSLGVVSGTGPVVMADNGTQIFIAANPDGYIYNSVTDAFQQITDPDFPGAVTVGYLDGYFVFNEPNSQRVWVTSLLDGLSVDPLDFASAEGSPDGLVSLIIDHREAWLFGTNSVEVWYNSGDPLFPLTRIQGAYNEIGCIAPYSVAKMDNSVFWLGADARGQGIVYRADGYQGVRISTHAVEFAIQSYSNLADAVGYTYQQDGHTFYVLNFTDADTTWVFDAATGAWHERAGFRNGDFKRHRGNNHARFNGVPIIGDYENGKLYAFDLDVYADNGQTQKWLRRWRALPTGANDLKRTAHHTLQIDCETGVGLSGYAFTDLQYLGSELSQILQTELGQDIVLDVNYTVGADPQIMLRWSDDGGHTWTGYRQASMGRVGRYGARVFFRALGMTVKLRDRVYEISGTDPVKVAIMGAELQLSPTGS